LPLVSRAAAARWRLSSATSRRPPAVRAGRGPSRGRGYTEPRAWESLVRDWHAEAWRPARPPDDRAHGVPGQRRKLAPGVTAPLRGASRARAPRPTRRAGPRGRPRRRRADAAPSAVDGRGARHEPTPVFPTCRGVSGLVAYPTWRAPPRVPEGPRHRPGRDGGVLRGQTVLGFTLERLSTTSTASGRRSSSATAPG